MQCSTIMVAADDEFGDWDGVKVGDGDGVVVHGACHGKFGGGGADHEEAAGGADIATGAGAEEQAMIAQGHRTGVAAVGEAMNEKGGHRKTEGEEAARCGRRGETRRGNAEPALWSGAGRGG